MMEYYADTLKKKERDKKNNMTMWWLVKMLHSV